jgi:hypothetical protein
VEAHLKWARHSHPNKPTRWVTRRYFGKFCKSRQDQWVFGDRDSGAYLIRFSWTNIVRHQMVRGTSSRDDPALTGYADLAAKILVVQYHGYHSARPSLPRERLPSQDFAIALVTEAMNRDAAIIIGTASHFWLSRVPGLGRYRHLVSKNSPQSKSLSPRNLGDGYAIVSAALDR